LTFNLAAELCLQKSKKMSIQIENLSKTYDKGKVNALQNIQLSVSEGELFGLIGPDGAGKTSLFRILTTLLLADSGKATVCGYDVVRDYKKIRQIAGYMPGRFSLYQDLSVAENLNFFATVFNTTVKENYHLIEDIYVQLAPFKDRPAGKLSGGMKQKLALCCALIHEPKILFLDEPTTGVDPVSRREFWDILARLKTRNITIFVSTPYMDEASRCDRIALIQNGQLLTIDTLGNILRDHPATIYSVGGERLYPISKVLKAHSEIKSCFAFGENLHVTLQDDAKNISFLKQLIDNQGFKHIEISEIKPNIEDVFIALMRQNLFPK
jgi:ABC-2 type transport system ATP-binding protein